MRRLRFATLLLAAFIAVPSLASAQNAKKGDRYRITSAELAEAPVTVATAYELISTMRPLWLSPMRGRTSSSNMEGGGMGGGATEVVVYIDDLRQQSLNDLRTVKASKVVEMRFLEQNRAVQLRGPGHEMGVIEVTTTDKKQ
jgi:hypothetical protein